jgi:superfamily I DNA/RNA helicase
MEEAKGLEYQAVVVMACDCEVLPLPERLAEKDIVASIDEIYDTERNLFYVACTRARDYLLVTCGDTPSEFLLDLL